MSRVFLFIKRSVIKRIVKIFWTNPACWTALRRLLNPNSFINWENVCRIRTHWSQLIISMLYYFHFTVVLEIKKEWFFSSNIFKTNLTFRVFHICCIFNFTWQEATECIIIIWTHKNNCFLMSFTFFPNSLIVTSIPTFSVKKTCTFISHVFQM